MLLLSYFHHRFKLIKLSIVQLAELLLSLLADQTRILLNESLVALNKITLSCLQFYNKLTGDVPPFIIVQVELFMQ